MTNLQAAIGLAQIEQFPMFTEKRKIIWNSYRKLLGNYDYFDFQLSRTDHCPASWLFTLLISEYESIPIDEIISRLKDFGIESRPVFFPMSEMPSFAEHAVVHKDPNCKNISRRGLSLPSSISLTEEEIKYISNSLLNILNIDISLNKNV
jgi:perosamine synthetase